MRAISFQRCSGACPQSRDLIEVGTAEIVTVEFDGNAEAEWEGENEDSGEIALDCTP